MAQGTILLVDDSTIIRKILTRLFTDAGYDAVTASSGEEALGLLDRTRPDAVLTDILMGGMDGYELCRRIRARPELRTVPILAVTEATELEAKLRGLEAGVDDFVTKDTAHAELLARVNALLARQRAAASTPAAPAAAPRRRQVVVFFGLKGGVGTSTLAANVALLLARQRGETVALLDLALQTGSSEVLLDVVPHVDLGSLAADAVNVAALQPTDVQRLVVQHPAGVALLAGPRLPEDAERVTPELAAAALQVLGDTYGCVVVDTPNWFSESALRAIDAADLVVLVTTPDVVGARAAVASRRVLQQRGLSAERLVLVLNAPYGEEGVDRQQLESLLQAPFAVAIPHDRGFVRALNEGRPRALQDEQPPGPTLAALAALAAQVEQRLAVVGKRK